MDMTKLVTLGDPRSAAAEAYRALRANLVFTSLDKPLESIVISSPAAVEPKSLVAANLAVALAQAEHQVILVDADLRRPHLHQIFDVPQEPGVTTFLVSREEEPIPLVETSVPGLRLLCSGPLPPNPADIVASQRMLLLLARLKESADIIILEAPPVTVAVDAAVLASHTDGLVLVTRSGHTRRDRIAQSKDMLEHFQVRLLGAVLTDSPQGGLLTGYD